MLTGTLCFFPLKEGGDLTAQINYNAILEIKKGNTAKAVQLWGKSAKINGDFSDYARLALAGVSLQQKRFTDSIKILNQISNESNAKPLALNLLAKVKLKQGLRKEAIRNLQKSLEINGAQLGVLKELVLLHGQSDLTTAHKYKADYNSLLTLYQSH